MRILVKIILLPVTLALSLLVLVLRFFHTYSGLVTNLFSGAFFLFGIAAGVLKLMGDSSFQTWESCLLLLLFSFLLSPFGLRGLVAVIAEGLDSFNQMLKEI